MTTDNNDWIYCTDSLPKNNQTVWWAIRCTAGPGEIHVYAGTIKNGRPYRGYDHFSYEPDYYHEFIAWKDRPMIAPTAPEYKKGILPVRDSDKGEWSLTATAKKY